MAIARVRTVLQGPDIVGGGVSDLYFTGSTGDEQQMVSAVALFWTDLGAILHAGNSADVDPNVYNIDETDGSIISIVSVGTDPAAIGFGGSGDPLPQATQGLLQWRTGGIVNNRIVRGRLFIPAALEAQSVGGVPQLDWMAAVQDAAEALLAEIEAQLVIWSRPATGRPGTSHVVTAANVWNRWAVLRSRRD